MSFIDQEILKSFVAKKSWLTVGDAPEGLDEAILQADSIIQSRLELAIPADPLDASPLLRNIACAIVVWFTTGLQENVEESELNRREKIYNNAIATLDLIKLGKATLFNDEGDAVTTNKPTSVFKSDTPRIEKL